MLTDEQKAELAADLRRDRVSSRSQSGRSLSYIEGWWAIAEANRIFGFDGWTRETLELRCIVEHERPVGRDGAKGWGVSYVAKVRVMVGNTCREGNGTGHGIDRDLGLAHESALKEAETDAMKRALMTFGNPFGLALYDKTQAMVSDDPTPNPDYVPPKLIASDPEEFPGDAANRKSSHELRKHPERWHTIVETIRACASEYDLRVYAAEIKDEVAAWPLGWRDQLASVYREERERILAVAA